MRHMQITFIKAFLLLACAGCSIIPVTPPSKRITTATSISDTFYVVDGKSGSDTNPGTQARPWKTIQKAADYGTGTIYILASIYPERVKVTRSNLSFEAQGTVKMKGFTVTGNNIAVHGFYITNQIDSITDGAGIFVSSDNCLLENNHIYFTPDRGIYLTPTSSGCVIRNNKIERVGWTGITVEGNNTLVENNDIFGTIQYHPYSSLHYDADGIRFFGTGNIFRANYIHDISEDDPANVNPHIDGFQTWDSSSLKAGSNAIFENNVILLEGISTTGFTLEGGVHNLTIRNNVVKALAGIRSYKNTGAPYTTPYNLSVLNNTFIVGLSYTNPDNGAIGLTIQDGTNITVKNNIFTELPNRVVDVSSGVMDYNLSYNSNGKVPSGTPQAHDLWGVNPLFVNPLENDFRLQSNSAACNGGENGTYMGAFPCD